MIRNSAFVLVVIAAVPWVLPAALGAPQKAKMFAVGQLAAAGTR